MRPNPRESPVHCNSLRRTFETTVNISLNTLHSARGKQLPIFRMRTLREAQLRDLIPSEEGCAAVLRAARQTSPAYPFVVLPQSCAVLVKNFVLNVILALPGPCWGVSTQSLPLAECERDCGGRASCRRHGRDLGDPWPLR